MRKCRICGCTDDNCEKCITIIDHPCSWVEDDLCSACQPLIQMSNDELIEFYNRIQAILKERKILN